MAAIAIASFFMAAPENMKNLTIRPAGGLLPTCNGPQDSISRL
jgi:hypothetical protein